MAKREEVVRQLTNAFWMEFETVVNYVSISIDLDGVRAEEIKKALAADVTVEISHAQFLAKRIKELGGRVPGSMEFKPSQKYLQPPETTTDVVSVIEGVIKAEECAVAQYNKIIKMCDGIDYVTQDLCIRLLADEEGHRTEFMGYLKEYKR